MKIITSYFFSLILLYSLSLMIGCKTGADTLWLQQIIPTAPVEEESLATTRYPNSRSKCNQSDHYIPDTAHLELTPIKTIYVNVHFMQNSSGKNSFDEREGRALAKQVIAEGNSYLTLGTPMNLPEGNQTPVLPFRYRYEIKGDPNVTGDDGIYFHLDDKLYYMIASKSKDNNQRDRSIFEKYGIQKDEVLNIFLQEHHNDSLASPYYKTHVRGISFGNWIKVQGMHHSTRDTIFRGKDRLIYGRYRQSKNINHEIGHSLGLRHSWIKNDFCEDTPSHANCWSMTGKPPCDLYKTSNNMMDYVNHPVVLTPCQLGIVHRNLSNKKSKIRKCLKKTWCTLDESQTAIIKKSMVWKGAKDLEGHIIVKNGVVLTIQCRVSLAQGAKIILEPQAQLILDGAILENDCGEEWEGILLYKKGTQQGKVTYLNTPELKNVKNPIAILP